MKSTLIVAAFAALLGTSAVADSIIEIVDPYARSSGAMAKTGAAFFTIRNSGDTDDVLIGARSEVAARVELHTHIMEDGIAKMRRVEAGFSVEAGSEHALERGADHVMFMGLKAPFVDGQEIALTLVFESGLTLDVLIPVDLERSEEPSEMGHSKN